MPRVLLFAGLRRLAGAKETAAPGHSIREVLASLERQHPGLEGRLVEDGQIRRHVVITVNGHTMQELAAPVTEDDVIAVFPPIAGG